MNSTRIRRTTTIAALVAAASLITPTADAGVFGTVQNDLPGSYTLMTAEWENGSQTCAISGVGNRSCKAKRLYSGNTSGTWYDADLFTVANSEFRVRHEGGTAHTFGAGVYYQIHDNEKAHCWVGDSGKPYCHVG